MMSERRGVQISLYTPSLDEIVDSDEFLRQLDATVDFSFIYDELRPYYSLDNGRYSTDPVVIVKSLLIAFIYGIASERRLEQELKYNALYRWFIGVGFDERVPDHSTISQLRRRKFDDADLFRKLFMHVLLLCAEKDLISGRLLVTDSTHVKANASKSSKMKVEIEHTTADFFARLDAYEAVEREHLGLPEIERKPPKSKQSAQTLSVTDPDAGWLSRPGKPDGFHYLSHQTLDAENGIIVDVSVTPGNTHDSIPYLEQIDRAADTLGNMGINVEAVGADSAYDNATIHKELDEREFSVYMPKTDSGGSSKAEYGREHFTYNRVADSFTCPAGQVLILRGTQRLESGVFREYRTLPKDCKNCSHRAKCLAPSQKSRKIQVHIFQDIVDKHHSTDGSTEYNDALRKRQIWCEGTFAAQKARHNLSRLYRRGAEAAQEHCLLSATAINLKRMVKCMG